jgi:hypothetical protein
MRTTFLSYRSCSDVKILFHHLAKLGKKERKEKHRDQARLEILAYRPGKHAIEKRDDA